MKDPMPIAPMDAYLASTEVIDWQSPVVSSMAKKIVAAFESDVEKAKVLFEWVRDNIAHSWDVGSDKITCKAS